MERLQKDENCEDDLTKFESCYIKSVEDYSYAIESGDDGKPALDERKTCDMMTTIIKTCQKLLLQNCSSKKYVNQIMDKYLKKILAVAHVELDQWNSQKCPAVREFEQRVKEEDYLQSSQTTSKSGFIPLLLILYLAYFI